MKKIFKIFILSFLILVLTKDTYAKEKTVETNINFTHLNVNEEDGIKVTNSKKVTAKLSKNIAKISVKGNKITIKAKKIGITDLTIKSPGMTSKKVRISITKRNKKETEKSIIKQIKGISSFCKDDIEKYPYLDWKSYKNTSDVYRHALNEQWKGMPEYLRDCLVACKIKIIFDGAIDNPIATAGTVGLADYGEKEITLVKPDKRDDNYDYEISLALIHEAAHIFDFLAKYDYNFNVKTKLKGEYKNNPEKYGGYGSTDLTEFYAECIKYESLKHIDLRTEESILEELSEKSCLEFRGITIKKPVIKYGNVNGLRKALETKYTDIEVYNYIKSKLIDIYRDQIPEDFTFEEIQLRPL